MKIQDAIQWLLALCTLVLLAACAGIPLSTMWHFHNFGPADFAALDPQVIRVAVQTLTPFNPDPARSRLTVAVHSKHKKNDRYTFSLKLLKKGKRLPQFARADSGETWSLFALTPPGIKQFRRLQHAIHRIDKSESNVSIRIKARPAKTAPKPPPSLPLTLMLKLKAKEEFITLFDGSVAIGKHKS